MGNENSKKSRKSQIFEIVDEKDNNNPEAINEITVAEVEKVLDKMIIQSETTEKLKTEPPDLTTVPVEDNASGTKTYEENITKTTDVKQEEDGTKQSVQNPSPIEESKTGAVKTVSVETKEREVDDKKLTDLVNEIENGEITNQTKKDKKKSKKETKKNKESKKIFKLSRKEKKLLKKNSIKGSEEIQPDVLNKDTSEINYVPCQESLEKSQSMASKEDIQRPDMVTEATAAGNLLSVQMNQKAEMQIDNNTEAPECASLSSQNEKNVHEREIDVNNLKSENEISIVSKTDETSTNEVKANVDKAEGKLDLEKNNQNYLQEAFDLIEEAKTSLPSFVSRNNPVVFQNSAIALPETIIETRCQVTEAINLKKGNSEISTCIPSKATTVNLEENANTVEDTGNGNSETNMSASSNNDEDITTSAIAQLCSKPTADGDLRLNCKDFSITEKHTHYDNVDIDVNTITTISTDEVNKNITVNSVTIETIKLANSNENEIPNAGLEKGLDNSDTNEFVKNSDVENENTENETISTDKKKKKDKKEKKQKVPKEKKKAGNKTSNETENSVNGDSSVTENASDTVHNLIKKFEDQNTEKKKEKNVAKKKKSKDEPKMDQNNTTESPQTKKDEEKKSKKKKKDKKKKMNLVPIPVEVSAPVKGIFDEVPVEIEVIEDDVVSLSSLSSVENDTNKSKSPLPNEDQTENSVVKEEISSSNENPNLLSVTPTTLTQNRPSSEDYVTLFINKDGRQCENSDHTETAPSTEADVGSPMPDNSPEIVQTNSSEDPIEASKIKSSEDLIEASELNSSEDLIETSVEVNEKNEHEMGVENDIDANASVANDSHENVENEIEKSESSSSNKEEKSPKKKSKKESKKNGGPKRFLFRQSSDTLTATNDVPSQQVCFDLDPKDNSPRERRRSFSEFFKPLGNIFSKNNPTSQSKKKNKKEATQAQDEKMSSVAAPEEEPNSEEQPPVPIVQQETVPS